MIVFIFKISLKSALLFILFANIIADADRENQGYNKNENNDVMNFCLSHVSLFHFEKELHGEQRDITWD